MWACCGHLCHLPAPIRAIHGMRGWRAHVATCDISLSHLSISTIPKLLCRPKNRSQQLCLHTLGTHVKFGSATPHVSSGHAHLVGRFGGSASPRRPGVILPPLPLQGGGWERQGPGARQGRRWRPLRLWEERGWLLGAGAGRLPQGSAWRPPEGRRGPYSGSVPQNEAMCGAASRADSRPGSPARAGAPLHGGCSPRHINTPPRGPCRHNAAGD